MSAISRDDLQKMTDSPKDREYFETELPQHIHDFYYQHFSAESTEDIGKCSQNSWIACLEYCKRMCVNRCDLITVEEHKIHPTKGGVSYNETYDGEKVQMLADVYCSLCFLFDKIPSIYGFSVLSGIDREWMQSWINAGRLTMSNRQNMQKKALENIKAAREQSLLNAAATGGKGVVGAIAILNNETWKDNNSALGVECKQIPTSADLPVFTEDSYIPQLQTELPAFELPKLNGDFDLG